MIIMVICALCMCASVYVQMNDEWNIAQSAVEDEQQLVVNE